MRFCDLQSDMCGEDLQTLLAETLPQLAALLGEDAAGRAALAPGSALPWEPLRRRLAKRLPAAAEKQAEMLDAVGDAAAAKPTAAARAVAAEVTVVSTCILLASRCCLLEPSLQQCFQPRLAGTKHVWMTWHGLLAPLCITTLHIHPCSSHSASASCLGCEACGLEKDLPVSPLLTLAQLCSPVRAAWQEEEEATVQQEETALAFSLRRRRGDRKAAATADVSLVSPQPLAAAVDAVPTPPPTPRVTAQV